VVVRTIRLGAAVLVLGAMLLGPGAVAASDGHHAGARQATTRTNQVRPPPTKTAEQRAGAARARAVRDLKRAKAAIGQALAKPKRAAALIDRALAATASQATGSQAERVGAAREQLRAAKRALQAGQVDEAAAGELRARELIDAAIEQAGQHEGND
jgi:hypothetical protein